VTTWFEAAWHVTTAKNGLSAKTLERTLGTRYRVAWTMLQRFRVAMVRSERERLSGNVEVDEILVGGVEHGGKRGRGTAKSVVVIAVEVLAPKGFGRLRMRHVPNASGTNLLPFVCDVVAPGSTVRTDGWDGYNDLPKYGYMRQKTVLSSSDDPAHVAMPGVHRVASLLKRWILGTHQGSVTPDHLQSYLEVVTFRFNRRALAQPRPRLPPAPRTSRNHWSRHRGRRHPRLRLVTHEMLGVEELTDYPPWSIVVRHGPTQDGDRLGDL
jgi:transposase-like protein